MTKKFITLFFSVITKNINWEILTRMKNIKYYEGSLKNPLFMGRVTKNQYIGGDYLKGVGGAGTVCRFKWGLGEKEG